VNKEEVRCKLAKASLIEKEKDYGQSVAYKIKAICVRYNKSL